MIRYTITKFLYMHYEKQARLYYGPETKAGIKKCSSNITESQTRKSVRCTAVYTDMLTTSQRLDVMIDSKLLNAPILPPARPM